MEKIFRKTSQIILQLSLYFVSPKNVIKRSKFSLVNFFDKDKSSVTYTIAIRKEKLTHVKLT